MSVLKPAVSIALALGWLGWYGTLADGHVIDEPSSYFIADSLINMGGGPYDSQNTLTTGNPQPWWYSPAVDRFYGGVPNAQQIWQFSDAVITRVQKTFALSGVPLTLTNNPNDGVPHAISVVSGTTFPGNPNAAGIADVGGSGFTFLDQFIYANNLDQLEWAVAHNVSHELMHDFGVGHHDTTGQYLDSGVTNWSTLINPNAVFSPAAVSDLLSHNFRVPLNSMWATSSGEMIGNAPDIDTSTFAAPVPEPSALALWGLGGLGLAVVRRTRRTGSAGA